MSSNKSKELCNAAKLKKNMSIPIDKVVLKAKNISLIKSTFFNISN